MSKLTSLVVAALCLVASASPALADALPTEPPNFTLEVALHTAVAHNPDIAAAQAKVDEAKLDKQDADLWWARSINANANYVVGNAGYGGVTATGTVLPTAAVGVGINLGEVLGGPGRSRRAEAEIAYAEANLRKTTLLVGSQVTAAYEDYEAAKQTSAMSGEMVQAAQTDMQVVERGFERGLQQANSLVGARLAIHRTRIDQIEYGGSVAKTWSSLLNLMGDAQWVTSAGSQNVGR